MTCHVRLWFDGVFQRQNLESAAKMALKRHPLLRSIAIGHIRSRTANLSWKPLKNIQPSFRWVKENIEDYTPDNRVLDPFLEICLKFYICEENGKYVMWVRFHHAHTDGTGIFSYLEDVFTYYENLINDSNIPVKEIKKEQLSKRATFGINRLMYISRTYLDLKRMIKFFKRSPSPLTARDYTITSQSPNIRNLTAAIKHVSTRSEYQKFKRSGKALSL